MMSLPAQDLADALRAGCDPFLLNPYLQEAADRLAVLEAVPTPTLVDKALAHAETAISAPMVFGGDLPSPVLTLLSTIALDVGALVDHLRKSVVESNQLRDALHKARHVMRAAGLTEATAG